MTLIEIIKDRRAELGLSQVALAKLTRNSPSTIGMIESGDRNPSKKTLADIFQVLSLDPDTLEPITNSAWDEYLRYVQSIRPGDYEMGANMLSDFIERYEAELKCVPSRDKQ